MRDPTDLGAALPVLELAIFGSSSEANFLAVEEFPAPLPAILIPRAAALRSAACFALKALWFLRSSAFGVGPRPSSRCLLFPPEPTLPPFLFFAAPGRPGFPAIN